MDPVCFHIGSRPVYWYGLMMAAAFVAGVAHLSVLGRREGRSFSFVSDLCFWVMLSGIGGARAAYVLANLDYFLKAPGLIFRVDQGGLIFYGGFLAAVFSAAIYARVKRAPLWPFADFIITALPLGQAFGRIGCFLNGCCYGTLSTAPWSVVVSGAARHPTPLYEAFLSLAVYGLLLLFYRRNSRPGRVLALYLILYPLGRFWLEFFRGDERLQWWGLNVAQELSLILLATGILLWFFPKRQPTGGRRVSS